MKCPETVCAVLEKETIDSRLGINFANRGDYVVIHSILSSTVRQSELNPSMKVLEVNGISAHSAVQVATIIKESPPGNITILALPKEGKKPTERTNIRSNAKATRPAHPLKLLAFRTNRNGLSTYFSERFKSFRHQIKGNRKKWKEGRKGRRNFQDGVVSSDDDVGGYADSDSADFNPLKVVSPPIKSDESTQILSISQENDTKSISNTDGRRPAFREIPYSAEQGSLPSLLHDGENIIEPQSMTTLQSAEINRFAKNRRIKDWVTYFRRSDPRYQILHFFKDVAKGGADNMDQNSMLHPALTSPLLGAFYKSSVFTVWRPTSLDAIRRMMLGEGVGKGLDIKGKSAKKGKLSGFVPFLQIHDEIDKREIRTHSKDGRIRVFYKTKIARDHVVEKLTELSDEMISTVRRAEKIVEEGNTDDETHEWALEKLIWNMTDPFICVIDDYAPANFGMEAPERLFWEGMVTRQDISRESDSENDTGRPSEPNFQNMNNLSLRKKPTTTGPRTVLLYYTAPDEKNMDPMNPLNLVMAYEENGWVMPVVSDFDCFLIGTRGVEYKAPLPEDQLEVLKWCVNQIETILASRNDDASWTKRWLNVLKSEAAKGFYPHVPPLGYSDPKTNSIIKHAIRRLKKEGSVRHGAECFNFSFPQDLDDHFLIISDDLSGTSLPWKYVDPHGLQQILKEKIDKGYTFPINPKWILCDVGWKDIYDKLMTAESANVQDSLKMWYPPDSGIREKIEEIHDRHKGGFVKMSSTKTEVEGTAAMDLAEQELRYYLTFQRAKRKLRGMLIWKRILDEHKQRKKVEATQIEAIDRNIAEGGRLISMENDDISAD